MQGPSVLAMVEQAGTGLVASVLRERWMPMLVNGAREST
jgi:hypothetical protein